MNDKEAARRDATQKHLDSIRTNLMPGMEGAAILDFHAGFTAGLAYANSQPQPEAVAEAVAEERRRIADELEKRIPAYPPTWALEFIYEVRENEKK